MIGGGGGAAAGLATDAGTGATGGGAVAAVATGGGATEAVATGAGGFATGAGGFATEGPPGAGWVDIVAGADAGARVTGGGLLGAAGFGGDELVPQAAMKVAAMHPAIRMLERACMFGLLATTV